VFGPEVEKSAGRAAARGNSRAGWAAYRVYRAASMMAEGSNHDGGFDHGIRTRSVPDPAHHVEVAAVGAMSAIVETVLSRLLFDPRALVNEPCPAHSPATVEGPDYDDVDAYGDK